MTENGIDECFVLIPQPDGSWATACFESEFVRPEDFRLTTDHIIPRSRGGSDEPENLHLSHLGCQYRQGGMIGGPESARVFLERFGPPSTPEGRIKGGRRAHELHPDLGRKNGLRTTELYPDLARQNGLRVHALYGNPATQSGRSKGGHVGGPKGNHSRWHVNRAIVNPNCSLCQKESVS